MAKFGIGQPLKRVEDARLLTGQGRYTADIDLDGQAFGHVLRSPHAHARIDGIDLNDALKMPGVMAIYTADEIGRAGLGTIKCLAPATQPDGSVQPMPPHPVLAEGKVRHVGDPVAFVVAGKADQARDAADTVIVDYDPLSAAADPMAAIEPGAPLIHGEAPGNISFRWEKGDRENTDAIFAEAAHIVRTRLINSRVVIAPIETRAAIGDWDGDRFTLYTPSQGPHFLRRQLARDIFNMPKDAFRLVTPDVGGSFGMKIFLYAEQVLVLLAARELGRPVKWVAERTADAFLSDSHGRDQINEVELALDGDGRFLALRVNNHANMGAYLSNFAPYIPTDCSVLMNSGVYRFQAIHVSVAGVFTNTVPVDAYRGAGRPEAIYLVERTVDAAARQLGIDPAELRRRNFIGAEEMPFTTAIGATYDSGDFARNLKDALKLSDYDGFAARRSNSSARGRLRGIGIAHYIENCGSGSRETGRMRVEADGSVTFTIGTQDNGQGHRTAYGQIIADRLGIDIARVRVIQGDTDLVATGMGTGGSRSLPIGGVSCDRATSNLIEKGKRIAAHLLEAAETDIEFADGTFTVAGTDRSVGIKEVAQTAFKPSRLPPDIEIGLYETATWSPNAPNNPNSAHVCEVEIDPDTGTIDIVRYTSVHDVGVEINPLLVDGQVHGGIAQGFGQALMEDVVFDPDSGQVLSGSFLDYCMPQPMIFAFSISTAIPCQRRPIRWASRVPASAVRSAHLPS